MNINDINIEVVKGKKFDKANYVYKIEVFVEGNWRLVYYGQTNNPWTRFLQHRNNIRKGVKKELYDLVNKYSYEWKMTCINFYHTKTDAKRYEIYMILNCYFNNYKLHQRVPHILDGGFRRN